MRARSCAFAVALVACGGNSPPVAAPRPAPAPPVAAPRPISTCAPIAGELLRIDGDGVPHVRIDATGIADRPMRDRLTGGLPQVIRVRVQALEQQDAQAPIAVAVHSCRETYLPFDDQFRFEMRTDAQTSVGVHASLDDAIAECLRFDDLPVGAGSDWAPPHERALAFAVRIEMNPDHGSPDRVEGLLVERERPWPTGCVFDEPPTHRARGAERVFEYGWAVAH